MWTVSRVFSVRIKMKHKQLQDQVIALRDGFYAVVNGKSHGPWPMKEYAQAGLATEIKRSERKRTTVRQREMQSLLTVIEILSAIDRRR